MVHQSETEIQTCRVSPKVLKISNAFLHSRMANLSAVMTTLPERCLWVAR